MQRKIVFNSSSPVRRSSAPITESEKSNNSSQPTPIEHDQENPYVNEITAFQHRFTAIKQDYDTFLTENSFSSIDSKIQFLTNLIGQKGEKHAALNNAYAGISAAFKENQANFVKTELESLSTQFSVNELSLIKDRISKLEAQISAAKKYQQTLKDFNDSNTTEINKEIDDSLTTLQTAISMNFKEVRSPLKVLRTDICQFQGRIIATNPTKHATTNLEISPTPTIENISQQCTGLTQEMDATSLQALTKSATYQQLADNNKTYSAPLNHAEFPSISALTSELVLLKSLEKNYNRITNTTPPVSVDSSISKRSQQVTGIRDAVLRKHCLQEMMKTFSDIDKENISEAEANAYEIRYQDIFEIYFYLDQLLHLFELYQNDLGDTKALQEQRKKAGIDSRTASNSSKGKITDITSKLAITYDIITAIGLYPATAAIEKLEEILPSRDIDQAILMYEQKKSFTLFAKKTNQQEDEFYSSALTLAKHRHRSADLLDRIRHIFSSLARFFKKTSAPFALARTPSSTDLPCDEEQAKHQEILNRKSSITEPDGVFILKRCRRMTITQFSTRESFLKPNNGSIPGAADDTRNDQQRKPCGYSKHN